MSKRSRTVALAILGAASFTLAGCRQDEVDAEAFPNVEACRQAAERGGLFSPAACDAAYQQAEEINVEAAPRYDSLEVCEAQHGVGACGSEQQASGQGSGGIFMPLLTGFLIGNLLSGGRSAAAGQPLYRTADGRYTNAAGTSAYSSNSGRAKLSPQQFARPAATIGKPPMTRATVAARGGFGATGASRGSSFGG